jgi:hypothetical protein
MRDQLKRQAADNARYARNPEKRRAASRERYANNPEKGREISRRSCRRRRDKAEVEYGARDNNAAQQRAAKSVATNNKRRWEPEDDQSLLKCLQSGMTRYQAAISIGRTLKAVEARLVVIRSAGVAPFASRRDCSIFDSHSKHRSNRHEQTDQPLQVRSVPQSR